MSNMDNRNRNNPNLQPGSTLPGYMPGGNMPGATLPGTNMPNMPGSMLPGTNTPNMPGATLPGTTTPNMPNMPGAALPGTATPNMPNMPGAALPGTSTPTMPGKKGNYVAGAALMRGMKGYPAITGSVCLHQTPQGVVITADIAGLPITSTGFFAFHMHEGSSCSAPGEHYNPLGLPHPRHAGDFPVLLETSQGRAYLRFITDRFTVNDAVGRTMIIHLQPDDYRSQPSGNAGEIIACGEILGTQAGAAPGSQLPAGSING